MSGLSNEMLALDPDQVSRLTRFQREERVHVLMQESQQILDEAISLHIIQPGKSVAGVVGLLSGGNDSTTICHLMLPRITHLAHANTTIGIEETRQFVRDTAALWGKPLLEFNPGREQDHYDTLVLDQGFPGPGHHFKMYQRLKERSLRRVRNYLVTNRNERVVFVAGRRRSESRRRANIPPHERQGSIVWVSPMIHWTKMDLNTYRSLYRLPHNKVTDLLHMSGECLCGSFAHAGELEEINEWFPDVVAHIRSLEERIADRKDIPERRKKWGWGASSNSTASKVGPLCSSCDARWIQEEII